jgi:hypothetical protein
MFLEVSKADAVESERPISADICTNVWIDRQVVRGYCRSFLWLIWSGDKLFCHSRDSHSPLFLSS